MTAENHGGIRKAASEVRTGALLGALWGAIRIMRPSARGLEIGLFLMFTALGAFVFLIRFLLSDLTKKGAVWDYAVWSFSFTLGCLIGIAVQFQISGYDGDLLLFVMLIAPVTGAGFGQMYRSRTSV